MSGRLPLSIFCLAALFGLQAKKKPFAAHIRSLPSVAELSVEEREKLWERYMAPIDLNSATEESLEGFPFLTPQQIEDFLEYRRLVGHYSSLKELLHLPSWDIDTIHYIAPFVHVGVAPKAPRSKPATVEQATLFLDPLCPAPKGSLGSRGRVNLTYKFADPRRYGFGFVCQKAGGEPLKYLHYGAYLLFKKQGPLEKVVLGDFNPTFGYGLTAGRSGYQELTIAPLLRRKGARLNTSLAAERSRGFRGFALQAKLSKHSSINLLFYGSYKTRYASVHQESGKKKGSGEKGRKYVKAIPDRASMVKEGDEAKTQLKEKAFGLVLTCTPTSSSKVGVSCTGFHYNLPFRRKCAEEDAAERYVSGEGYLTLFGDTTQGAWWWGGEVALSHQQKGRVALGGKVAYGNKSYLGFLWRRQSPYFHTLYGNRWSLKRGERLMQSFTVEAASLYDWGRFSPTFSLLQGAPKDGKRYQELRARLEASYEQSAWLHTYILEGRLPCGSNGQKLLKVKGSWHYAGAPYYRMDLALASKSLAEGGYSSTVGTMHTVRFSYQGAKICLFGGLALGSGGGLWLYEPNFRSPYALQLPAQTIKAGVLLEVPLSGSLTLKLRLKYQIGKGRGTRTPSVLFELRGLLNYKSTP